MNRRNVGKAFVAIVAIVAAVALSSCSADSPATTTSPKATVESQIVAEMTKAVGKPPDSVTCPSDLSGPVGNTMKCKMVAEGATGSAIVTVTGVDEGKGLSFSVKGSPEP